MPGRIIIGAPASTVRSFYPFTRNGPINRRRRLRYCRRYRHRSAGCLPLATISCRLHHQIQILSPAASPTFHGDCIRISSSPHGYHLQAAGCGLDCLLPICRLPLRYIGGYQPRLPLFEPCECFFFFWVCIVPRRWVVD